MKYAAALLLPIALLVQASASAQDGYLSPEQKRELNRRAQMEALDELFNDPEVIREGIRRKEEVDKAQMEALTPPSQQRIRTIKIKRNETKIHKLFVYPNQVTVITLADSMGEPWPLRGAPVSASPDVYSVNYDKNDPGLITIETKTKFIPSNVVLPLKGILRPLSIQLASNNETLDAMVDIVVEGKSPLNGITPQRPYAGLNIPDLDEKKLTRFFGIPPEDARELSTIGSPDVKAWKWRNMFVVIAPYKLMHPSKYIDAQSQIDSDLTVYLMKKSEPLITFLNENTSDIINVEVVGG